MAQQLINTGTVSNDGTGTPLKGGGTIINENFTEVYEDIAEIKEDISGIDDEISFLQVVKNTFGFGYYDDSLTTASISIGTSWTQITIDGTGTRTRTDFLPLSIRGTGQFLVGSIITPENSGDDFDGRLDVNVSSKSGSPNYMEVILDFGGSTPDTLRAFTGYLQTSKTPPFNQSLPLDFFTAETFIANGAKIYARTDSGSFTITNRAIKISRKGANMES